MSVSASVARTAADTETLADACDALRSLLEQLGTALRALTNEQYGGAKLGLFGGPVGPQVRHTLDHVANLASGLAVGSIDYDARDRGTPVETDRDAALQQIDVLIARLDVARRQSPLARVRVAIRDHDAREPVWADSCAAREIAFVESHTVHHMALIAAMLRALGIEPSAGFGYARSTLRHLRQSECAPSH